MRSLTHEQALDMMRLVWACHELVLELLDRGLSVLYMDADVVSIYLTPALPQKRPIPSKRDLCLVKETCTWHNLSSLATIVKEA